LRQWNVNQPVNEMVSYRELVSESFKKQPVCTMSEAGERIFQLSGLRRGPTQVRKFPKDLGMKWQRVRAIPVLPPETCLSTPNSTRFSRRRAEAVPGHD
jgi:hypothetical protein